MVDIKEPMTVSADCQGGDEMELTTPAINPSTDLGIEHITKSKSLENDEFCDATDEISELNNAKRHDVICEEKGKVFAIAQ